MLKPMQICTNYEIYLNLSSIYTLRLDSAVSNAVSKRLNKMSATDRPLLIEQSRAPTACKNKLVLKPWTTTLPSQQLLICMWSNCQQTKTAAEWSTSCLIMIKAGSFPLNELAGYNSQTTINVVNSNKGQWLLPSRLRLCFTCYKQHVGIG